MKAVTRAFRETVVARVAADPGFRAGLYQQAVQSLLDGDTDVGRLLLRDFINATIGFAELSRQIDVPRKSLMRMVGPGGNPEINNVVAILRAVTKQSGLALVVQARRGQTGRK